MYKAGIYKITNLENNKVYIGRSTNVYIRLRTHKSKLKNNKHYNIHLQNAFNKYPDFSFDQIECLIINDVEYLKEREEFWIKYFDSNNLNKGYNKTKGGNDGPSFPYCVIKACKRNMFGKNNSFFGKKMPQEAKKILSDKAKLRPNNFKGKVHSDKTKNTISLKAKKRYKNTLPNCINTTIFLYSNKSGEEFVGIRRDFMSLLKSRGIRTSSSDVAYIENNPGKHRKNWYVNTCPLKK